MNVLKNLFALLGKALETKQVCKEAQNSITDQTLIELYKLSKKHDMSHLVAEGLEKYGLLLTEDGISGEFLYQRNMSVYRYEQINYEFEEICRILEETKIEHIPLKGSVIRKYYPEPWMRTSCDIDILIKKEDLEIAIKALQAQGFTHEGTQTYDAQMWSPSGVHLELHFDLSETSVSKNSAMLLAQAWERTKRCKGFEYRLEFDDAFFYFYHIAHMVKHFLGGGCGIRPFLDVWILKQQKSFSDEAVDDLLKQADLLIFAKNAEKLANVWFGDKEHDETTRQMENYIVNAGVYGSLDNRVALKQAKVGGKIKYLLSRVFLSYSLLKISYPKLEKYPILFPFYQVVRWCRIIFGKNKKRAFRELKSITSTKDERKIYLAALCDNLGLKNED